MQRYHPFIATFLFLVLGCSLGAPGLQAQTPDLAITHATVIAMTGAPPQPDMTVIVSGDRITTVGPASSVSIPENATVMDARGTYLIPGLWDMHVHLLYEGALDRYLPMLVANGVTGVRDMNGPMPFEDIRALQQQIQEGTLLGPRFVTPGPLVDGPARSENARGPGVVVVATEDEARAAARSLKQQGAGFIKVYNSVTPALLRAITEEAARQQIPVAGHIPHGVDAAMAAEMGLRSAEHLNNVLEACSSAGDTLRQQTLEVLALLADPNTSPQDLPPETTQAIIAARKKVLHTFDPARCRRVIEAFVQHDTWQCPTLASNRALDLAALDTTFATDPRLSYVPPSIQELWSASVERHPYRATPAERRLRFQTLQKIVGMMKEAGVRFLAGTDLGVPYVFAGFSLHDELALLVEAGLTPLEALQAATRNPAEFLGKEDVLGTIAPGNYADLVLLDEDPLENIRHTRAIHAVVLNGRLLTRATLDALLNEAKANAQAE